MTTNHTPGPWELGSAGFQDEPPYVNIYHEGQAPILASVLAEEVNLGTAEANARLIVAAPDLLAVINEAIGFCVNARETWDDWEDHLDVGLLFAKLTAVKDKATKGDTA